MDNNTLKNELFKDKVFRHIEDRDMKWRSLRKAIY